MKAALIYSVRVAGVQMFNWRWRSEDGDAASTDAFEYFHDCLENARRKGYECRFDRAAEGTVSPPAPTSA